MAGQHPIDLAPQPASARPASTEVPDPGSSRAGAALDPGALHDVELDVRIELGRARMPVGDVLQLAEGSVVELDKLAGDPVDVYVNGRLVARGEVLVLEGNFCVRVGEIIEADAEGAGR